MEFSNQTFDEKFEELNKFYKMRNPEKIRDFVQNNKGMIHLLYKTEHHLIKEFPKGKFELQQQNDITGEGYHK